MPIHPPTFLRRAWMACVACLLLAIWPAGARAQSMAQALGPADRAEIAAFRLDTDVLARLQSVVAESQRLQLRRAPPDMSRVHSLDDLANQLVAIDPGYKPLLARYGFTPHQFVVANLALVTTAMAVSVKRDSASAADMPPETANMQFYESHEAQINRLLMSGANGQ